MFRVSIDEHDLTLIEADDTALVPSVPLLRVAINTAQRYSLVFNTSQDVTGDSFFLRARMDM